MHARQRQKFSSVCANGPTEMNDYALGFTQIPPAINEHWCYCHVAQALGLCPATATRLYMQDSFSAFPRYYGYGITPTRPRDLQRCRFHQRVCRTWYVHST